MIEKIRVLRDQLLSANDWEAAAHAYATEHDRYYGALHRIEGWKTELLFEIGPEADARAPRASLSAAKSIQAGMRIYRPWGPKRRATKPPAAATLLRIEFL